MEFDFRILGVLLFFWGVLNFTTGYIDGDYLNMSKGVVAIAMAAYISYFSKKIIILHK